MSRNQIDGDQVQDETLTGNDILDASVKRVDLENYSFATLDDVTLVAASHDDLISFDSSIGKFINKKSYDLNFFYKRTFSSVEDIIIPVDKVLQMHSPIFDGELYIDGEVYIL